MTKDEFEAEEAKDIKPDTFSWYATVGDPEFKKRQKEEQKEAKENVIVGEEETIYWRGGEFQVINCDRYADGDGLYLRRDNCWFKVIQLGKWDKYGPTKYVCNIGSKWQAEEATHISEDEKK